MINVYVHRGPLIESAHKVIAVVSDSQGDINELYGTANTIIYPRSSIKPIQALPIVLSGANDRYGLTSKELAIASASHNGESFHVECVESWLKKLNLSCSDLECGVHPPSSVESNYELVRAGREFNSIHNNCSGKHTGMLCVAKQLNELTNGYSKVNHKVQQLVKSTIEELISYSIPEDAYGIDGCSLPTWAIPIDKFALGLARLAEQELTNKKYVQACKLIFEACVNNPDYVAGTERYCTLIMRECAKQVLVKTGAEGVMAAAIRRPGKPALGIAVKCLDGASRASEAALAFLLNKYKVLPDTSIYLNKKIVNWNNIETGFIEVSC
jgi:L-asparaginase II